MQEALTNVVRHAGTGAEATVTIRATDDGIDLIIDDNGHGAPRTERARSGRQRAARHARAGPHVRRRCPLGAETGRRFPGARHAAPTTKTRTPEATSNDLFCRRPTIHEPGRRRFSPAIGDAALATLMAIVATLEVISADPTASGPHFTPTGFWAYSLRLGSCATLAFRRRHPTIAYAVAWMLGLALTIGDYQVGVMIFVLWIGLYSIAAYATGRQLVSALMATIIGIAVVAWSRPPDLTGTGAVWAGAFFAASAIAGFTVRRERDRRTTELDAQQDASAAHVRHARLVLASERLRIADELGAVITRSIDTIARHAETGSQLIDHRHQRSTQTRS